MLDVERENLLEAVEIVRNRVDQPLLRVRFEPECSRGFAANGPVEAGIADFHLSLLASQGTAQGSGTSRSGQMIWTWRKNEG